MLKKQIALLTLALTFSTQAYDFKHLKLHEEISTDSTLHFVPSSIIPGNNKKALEEVHNFFESHYDSPSTKVVDLNFEYLSDGSKAPLILASACSVPNEKDDYAAHNSQVMLGLQKEIASICQDLGYSSINFYYGTFPGGNGVYANVENNNGVTDILFHIVKLNGKRSLAMKCAYTHGLCSGKRITGRN